MDLALQELSDLGADDELVELAARVIAAKAIPLAGISFGVSNGGSCVIVPAGGVIVYQIYKSGDVFARVAAFCRAVAEVCRDIGGHPGCAFFGSSRRFNPRRKLHDFPQNCSSQQNVPWNDYWR